MISKPLQWGFFIAIKAHTELTGRITLLMNYSVTREELLPRPFVKAKPLIFALNQIGINAPAI
jgi:hypothetical protein